MIAQEKYPNNILLKTKIASNNDAILLTQSVEQRLTFQKSPPTPR